MSGGGMMAGMQDRLLPASIPYRFFATAVVMQVAAWAVLLAGADDVPAFVGGFGPVLAGLHLITLGVLTMTALGAADALRQRAGALESAGDRIGARWADGEVSVPPGFDRPSVSCHSGSISTAVAGNACANRSFASVVDCA